MTVPFVSTGAEDWQDPGHLRALESHLAQGHTVGVQTVQSAVQICLEVLGTRTDMVPVLLPATAPPDTLGAVLRAGGHPILLDIDPVTLQMDPDQVKTLLLNVSTGVGVLPRVGGQNVSQGLLDAFKDLPTVLDARMVPHQSLGYDDLTCTFNVYDTTTIAGSGAVILHKYPKQTQQLRIVRSGVLGHSAAMPELVAARALAEIKKYEERVREHHEIAESYQRNLEAMDQISMQVFPVAKWPAPFYVKVPNAVQAVEDLREIGVEAVRGVYGLYNLPEVRKRYAEAPEYPGVEAVQNKIVCLPTHVGVRGLAGKIIKTIVEGAK